MKILKFAFEIDWPLDSVLGLDFYEAKKMADSLPLIFLLSNSLTNFSLKYPINYKKCDLPFVIHVEELAY